SRPGRPRARSAISAGASSCAKSSQESRQHPDDDPGRPILRPVNALGRLPEIGLLRVADVHEGLRIPIHEREPAALHHYLVARAERVVHVGQPEADGGWTSGLERLGLLEAVAKPPAEHFTPYQLLEVPQSHPCRIRAWIGVIGGVDVNQLD